VYRAAAEWLSKRYIRLNVHAEG